MKWDIQYLPEVEKDLKALSHNQVISVRKEGIRIVYKTIRTDTAMLIIVIGIREDNAVYEAAQNRIIKNKL